MNRTETEYISRINKAFDYIDKNLEKSLSLEELAAVASFSKFHFSRIFQSMVGESPFQFILRVRLERAAMMLLSLPHLSVTEIGYKCGFSDISVFSRNFKTFFRVSATRFREEKPCFSNIRQSDRNSRQPDDKPVLYFCTESQTLKWRTTMNINKSVEVKKLPAMNLAYLRHMGPYKGDANLFEKLWEKLFAWAGPRGLIGGKDFRSLIIYHDDPNVTSGDKLRMSLCITVPKGTKTEGEIGSMSLEAARYAVARFELDASQFQQAWDWVYGQWLPSSGYQPDDKPCFEMYPEEPRDGKFIVDICVPVKPI
ncbi:MAG TPA: AraC family transcriptional regulator [Prolixibacteraceae bacterium]|nr:AraC family transcriptional regulator [Prolixibacteraceae bacterium]